MQHQIFLVFQLIFVKVKYLVSKEKQKMFLQKIITSLNMHTFQKGCHKHEMLTQRLCTMTLIYQHLCLKKKSKAMSLYFFVVCKDN